jgi:hypothetical protein
MTYEAAAKLNGEVRVYADTTSRIDWTAVKAKLGYSYAFERPHHSPDDPWEYAFGDPRGLGTEADFFGERDRIAEILQALTGIEWTAEVHYYSSGTLRHLYHWSSTEGTLHPNRVETVE